MIDLNFNNLESFENINHENLKNLRFLYLGSNKFSEFNFSIIDKLPSLERLDLRNNDMAKIDEQVLSKYKERINFKDE